MVKQGEDNETSPSEPIRFTILGQPYSKSNRRILSVVAGKPRSIKSKEALAFESAALRQIPPAARQRLEGPVRVTLRIFYKDERPDLDESLILDILQDRYVLRQHMKAGRLVGQRTLVQNGVYRNDRQVRERHVYHFIDKTNPRTEIEIERIR